MKKILIMFASLLLLVSLSGCKSEVSAEDVSKAIANIYSDSEGNVTIALSDGREFNLGNMKGEKGDKGDKGDPGVDGKDGKDGLNGLNGKDGINGADGKDGADGANGKDGVNATPITDYVKDVTLTDENILTITYGDGTTDDISRIELNGQYILKEYVKLYDADDNYVATVLGTYRCYEEGEEVYANVQFPIKYEGKYYNYEAMDPIPEDIEITYVSGSDPNYAGFVGKMPARNVDYYFKAKEAHIFTVAGKFGDELLFEDSDYVTVGKSFTKYPSYGVSFNKITLRDVVYYCENIDGTSIDSMPSNDVYNVLDYVPLFSYSEENPYPNIMIKLFNYFESFDATTVGEYKEKLSDWFDDNGFTDYTFVIEDPVNDDSPIGITYRNIYPSLYRDNINNYWVNKYTPITVEITRNWHVEIIE